MRANQRVLSSLTRYDGFFSDNVACRRKYLRESTTRRVDCTRYFYFRDFPSRIIKGPGIQINSLLFFISSFFISRRTESSAFYSVLSNDDAFDFWSRSALLYFRERVLGSAENCEKLICTPNMFDEGHCLYDTTYQHIRIFLISSAFLSAPSHAHRCMHR
jgi:hypothetical protein